jgi:hypothetical protein
MKENYELDYELYPDGISNELKVFEESVWDRGYYLEIENGIWYEMYVNETVKSYYPTIEEDFNNIDSISYNFRSFKGLWLGNYEDSSQITFFVPKDENEFTLNEMTNIFI